jgi:hypothetical protein
MKRLFLALVLALPILGFSPHVKARAQAQTVFNLHGHPQLATYAPGTVQWPSIDHQGHWFADGQLQHVHLVQQLPLYAEITGTGVIAVPFTLMMFQVNGGFDQLWSQFGTVNYVFDGPAMDTVYNPMTNAITVIKTAQGNGSTTPPFVNGDPQAYGLIMESGHILVDTSQWTANYRGWVGLGATARVYIAEAGGGYTKLDVTAEDSVYDLQYPGAPETPPPGENGILVGTHVVAQPPNSMSAGEVVTSFNSMIPILPISAPWPVTVSTYTYSVGFPAEIGVGFTEFSLDPNIHEGKQGTQILTHLSETPDPANGSIDPNPDDGVAFGFGRSQYLIDPATLGVGAHTILARWEQPTGSSCSTQPDGTGFVENCTGDTAHYIGGEQAWALVKIPVTVASIPPAGTPPFPLVGPGAGAQAFNGVNPTSNGGNPPPQPPPPPNPCVATPLVFPSNVNFLAVMQTFFSQALASVGITVTDTRGCTATAVSGS